MGNKKSIYVHFIDTVYVSKNGLSSNKKYKKVILAINSSDTDDLQVAHFLKFCCVYV